jgi:hypothetical protein
LDCIDGTGLAVFGAEADFETVETDQAMIRDPDPMGVAAKILKDLGRTAEGLLGIHHPLSVVQTRL